MVPSQLPSDLQSAEFIEDLSFYANIIMSYIVCSLISLALWEQLALLRSIKNCMHIEAKTFLLWLHVAKQLLSLIKCVHQLSFIHRIPCTLSIQTCNDLILLMYSISPQFIKK